MPFNVALRLILPCSVFQETPLNASLLGLMAAASNAGGCPSAGIANRTQSAFFIPLRRRILRFVDRFFSLSGGRGHRRPSGQSARLACISAWSKVARGRAVPGWRGGRRRRLTGGSRRRGAGYADAAKNRRTAGG